MPSLSSDLPGSGTWTREQVRTANGGMVARRVPAVLDAFPVRPEASLEEIRAHGEGLAVLRLDPADEEPDRTPAPDGAR
jgi:hypothetical protein